MAQHQRQEADADDHHQHPEHAGAHHITWSSARATLRRAGSSAMMRSRSGSGRDAHWPISVSVRPQPRQSVDRGSMVQTLVQGELIGDIVG
jgi:hypothetical protein